MAGAMLQGWLEGGLDPARFTVSDPAKPELPPGVTSSDTIPEHGAFDAILLGIKPQLLGEVVPQVEALAGPGTVLISILAGVELTVLETLFPRAGGVVRLMPNLAAAIGKSPVAVASRGLDGARQNALLDWLAPLGTPDTIDQGEFDLVTALAGSGPAFVYRFIDALATAAADLGLAPDKAKRLALAMVEGAAA